MRWRGLLALAGAALLLASCGMREPDPPLVLAAASLQESMNAAADAWVAKGHKRPVLSFAASSALARQIGQGAPADLFASADEPWMDDVEKRGLQRPGTRAPFLGNALVLVVPADDRATIALAAGAPLAALIGDGRLAMADPDAVPAGRYGKSALEKLGLWDGVSARVVRAENVRAALALVERGAARAGVVYATDARASAHVRVAGTFPADSHSPIRYPLAVLKSATSLDAGPFRDFLLSQEGRAIFIRYGFTAP